MQPATGEPSKRPRLALQTPVGPAPQSMQGLVTPSASVLPPSTRQALPSGDVLDYLRGRGGKIKELEDELAASRSRCEKLQEELATRNESISMLTAENKALKTTAMAPASGAASSALQHLNHQLDGQLRKALRLEQDLAAAKQREAVSAQRVASLESLLAEQAAAQSRLLAEAEATAGRLTMEAEGARAEARIATQRAELAERVAARRVEAEQEIRKVAQAQLEEVRAQAAGLQADLEAARSTCGRLEAEAAALRNSAAQVRLQLLEEELRTAREALVLATAKAAGTPRGTGTEGVITPRGAMQAAAGVSGGSRIPLAPKPAAAAVAAGAAQHQQAPTWAVEGAGDVLLPEVLRGPWAALTKALSVHSGLPLAAQAAEAARAATALVDEAAELRTTVKGQNESLMQIRAAASGSDAYASELQSQLADVRTRLEKSLTAERVAERRAAAIEAERDALRAALSAGTTGGTTTTTGTTGAAAAARGPGAENAAPGGIVPGSLAGRVLAGQQAAAVEQLTALNEGRQKQVSSLQQEVASATAASEAQALAARSATSRAEAAEQRVRQLEREADGLAAEVAALQERLGRGELIRAGGVRVLHLRHNPEKEAQKEAREAAVTRLAAENEALKGQLTEAEGRLAELQQQLASSARGNMVQDNQQPPSDGLDAAAAGIAATIPPPPGLGGGVAIAVKDAEITVLRRKVDELEKAMSRLKLVFKERITVFREACYSLFGYRVDMTAEATAAADAAGAPTTFTLKPQHADDPAALLVFRYTAAGGSGGSSAGRMELIPNAFTQRRLAREVDTFVRKFNCIPALTANLTMDNFQKQTQC